ncbi:MAG: hypothetical protein AAF830_16960 [Pseudomonadota bacterium]
MILATLMMLSLSAQPTQLFDDVVGVTLTEGDRLVRCPRGAATIRVMRREFSSHICLKPGEDGSRGALDSYTSQFIEAGFVETGREGTPDTIVSLCGEGSLVIIFRDLLATTKRLGPGKTLDEYEAAAADATIFIGKRADSTCAPNLSSENR